MESNCQINNQFIAKGSGYSEAKSSQPVNQKEKMTPLSKTQLTPPRPLQSAF
jgi:hypothetical protein